MEISMTPSLEATLRQLAQQPDCTILGIVGAPGAGKTTLVESILAWSTANNLTVAWLPMDGYHLADVELTRLGLLHKKGIIETFDGYGYVNTLRRIREGNEPVVYAPAFERDLEQPIAGALPIASGADLVLTEGNYLLDPSKPWTGVRDLVDEIWFVDASSETRRARLMTRHVQFGKSPQQASDWIDDVDAPNGVRIRTQMDRAHRIIDSEGDFAERN
ncbi:MAG: nucleoside/nucleotide kinase family protein [Ancrocorticia sp.]